MEARGLIWSFAVAREAERVAAYQRALRTVVAGAGS